MRYLVVALLVASCGSRPAAQYQWVSDSGASRAQFERDFGQCEAHVLSVTQNVERGVSIMGACMRGKGWILVER